ncbi:MULTISPECIES: thioredoxin [Luteococcus]|uniref:Thioredoxin n=1 Tax=Luteococcus japonicus LSP_Lj1 TaxID=1255658 RepID=A0A1R4J8E1_9ACTN|nr:MULTISPECIES: thioredoxin [Luteococcus]MDN5563269.1 thioredoxin [Luteococcus sp.]SJN28356.1 Thioredoxin [Luteococcus japonicus LSP_Lj1]
MSNVKDVTDKTFVDEVVMNPKPVLVDYWADWCSPCKQLSPIIEELSTELGGSVDFVKMDTNTNTQIPTEQGILSLPTLQIWQGGRVVKSFQGAKTKGALLKALNEYI